MKNIKTQETASILGLAFKSIPIFKTRAEKISKSWFHNGNIDNQHLKISQVVLYVNVVKTKKTNTIKKQIIKDLPQAGLSKHCKKKICTIFST